MNGPPLAVIRQETKNSIPENKMTNESFHKVKWEANLGNEYRIIYRLCLNNKQEAYRKMDMKLSDDKRLGEHILELVKGIDSGYVKQRINKFYYRMIICNV